MTWKKVVFLLFLFSYITTDLFHWLDLRSKTSCSVWARKVHYEDNEIRTVYERPNGIKERGRERERASLSHFFSSSRLTFHDASHVEFQFFFRSDERRSMFFSPSVFVTKLIEEGQMKKKNVAFPFLLRYVK